MTPTLSDQSTSAQSGASAETPININRVLADLRRVWDEEEGLNERLSALSKQKMALKAQLLDYHTQTGLANVGNEEIGVSFKADLRARVDPEKWADLHKWAVDTGNTHIFHRRLTDAKVIDLCNSGTALPEGLTLESFVNMNIRRRNGTPPIA